MTFFRSFLLGLICCVVVVGCEKSPKVDPPPMKPQDRNVSQSIESVLVSQDQSLEKIEQAVESNKTAIESAKTHVDEVNRNAAMIGEKSDDPAVKASADGVAQHAAELDGRLDLVDKNNQTIGSEVGSIRKGGDQLKSDNKTVLQLQKRNAALENEKEKLQNGAIKDLYATLSVFFGLGFLTIIAGVVLAFTVNRKLGYSIAILGLLGLALAAGAIFYLKTIAGVGVALIVGAIVVSVGIGIWHLVKEVREKEDYKVATQENVELIQTLKQELPASLREKYFGLPKEPEPVAVALQSDTTKEIVQKVKTELTEGESK